MTFLGNLVLLGIDAAAIAVAIAITGKAVRAYRRKPTRTHCLALLGFVLLTIGVVSEGFLFQVTGLPWTVVHGVEMILFLAGFSAFYSSLR